MSEQRCIVCQGHLTLQRANRLQLYDDRWVIIEHLPAMVCVQCGERYFTPQVHDLVVDLIRGQTSPQRTEVVDIYDAEKI
jgi:YgiT-type zinc finger domain-containing protein